MSDLLQLPPELLERVINKLECKSYFRLQQTCHDMADFIQNNRQIKAWMSDFILTIKAHDTIPSCYISSRNRNGIIIEAGPRDKCNLFELRNLFGLHFGIVQIEQNFERAERSYLVNCCNMLKDYRITASIFDTSEMRASQLSHELYVDFLKVLKPVKIDLDSRGANLYEGLLKAKTLKNVDISLRLKDMPDLMIMNDLLGMFSKLSVTMRTEADFMKCLDVAKTFMQYLREPRPNLRSFIFEASYQGHYIPLPSLEEILHLLQDFDPILERDDKPRIRWWPNSFKCRLKPGSRFCRLVFNGTVEITFIDYMTLDEFGQLKLDWKSYFRLQQTCKDMTDFIQTNRNVGTCLPSVFWINIAIDQTGHHYYFTYKKAAGTKRVFPCEFEIIRKIADFKSLYGVCFPNILIAQEQYVLAHNVFLTDFCNIVKEYRITSRNLDRMDLGMGIRDRYTDLVMSLKPVEIKINSSQQNLCGILLKAKQLKRVYLWVDDKDMPDREIMKDFLEKFKTLYVKMHTDLEMIECIYLITTILQYLGEPLPNLRSFTFIASFHDSHPRPSEDEILELFHQFNPMYPQKDRYGFEYSFKCQFIPGNRYCKIGINRKKLTIDFSNTMISRI